MIRLNGVQGVQGQRPRACSLLVIIEPVLDVFMWGRSLQQRQLKDIKPRPALQHRLSGLILGRHLVAFRVLIFQSANHISRLENKWLFASDWSLLDFCCSFHLKMAEELIELLCR